MRFQLSALAFAAFFLLTLTLAAPVGSQLEEVSSFNYPPTLLALEPDLPLPA